MPQQYVVTSALPYANGPIHLGHMVEHVQTDIWVRFQKLSGNRCVYVCADDTHGTAIMIRARSEQRSEQELIAAMREAHLADFAGFVACGGFSYGDTLGAVCGDTGAAHPLLMLVDALENAAEPTRTYGTELIVRYRHEGFLAMFTEVETADFFFGADPDADGGLEPLQPGHEGFRAAGADQEEGRVQDHPGRERENPPHEAILPSSIRITR